MILDISKEEKRKIITSGTYLHSFCPFCSHSLIENDELILIIEENNGDTGRLCLSPYLNVFLHESTIHIPDKSEAKDIKCPHCCKSLIVKSEKCGDCGSRIVRFEVEAVSRLIDFNICARKGCEWHGLSHDDLDDIILDDSLEW
jgi:hypothetical protein